jgi:hypothetical protein
MHPPCLLYYCNIASVTFSVIFFPHVFLYSCYMHYSLSILKPLFPPPSPIFFPLCSYPLSEAIHNFPSHSFWCFWFKFEKNSVGQNPPSFAEALSSLEFSLMMFLVSGAWRRPKGSGESSKGGGGREYVSPCRWAWHSAAGPKGGRDAGRSYLPHAS